MIDYLCCLANLKFSGIPFTLFVYKCNNQSLSIICCCLSGDTFFFFSISIDCVNVSSICTCDLIGFSQVLFEATFAIFSALLLPTKSPIDRNLISGFSWISHYILLSLITIVKFILFSISRSTEFWSINHTSIYQNSEQNVPKKIWLVGEIFSS